MKPQRTSSSKPGLELQILCPCLLGNSAAFRILIKALFKLRTLLKYIGQSLYIYTAIVHSTVMYLPLTLNKCISILPICTRCILVTFSHLSTLVHKYKNKQQQIQLKCINSLEHCCFFITWAHQHKTCQKSVVLMKNGEVRKAKKTQCCLLR